MAYLRENLVAGRRWLDDDEFVRVMEISQTLPGLNATNMSVLIGERQIHFTAECVSWHKKFRRRSTSGTQPTLPVRRDA